MRPMRLETAQYETTQGPATPGPTATRETAARSEQRQRTAVRWPAWSPNQIVALVVAVAMIVVGGVALGRAGVTFSNVPAHRSTVIGLGFTSMSALDHARRGGGHRHRLCASVLRPLRVGGFWRGVLGLWTDRGGNTPAVLQHVELHDRERCRDCLRGSPAPSVGVGVAGLRTVDLDPGTAPQQRRLNRRHWPTRRTAPVESGR